MRPNLTSTTPILTTSLFVTPIGTCACIPWRTRAAAGSAIIGLEKLYMPDQPFNTLDVATALQRNGSYMWSAVPMFGVIQFNAQGQVSQRGTVMVKIFSRGRPRQPRWTEVMQPTWYFHDKAQTARFKLEDDDFPLFIVWHAKPDKISYTRVPMLPGQASLKCRCRGQTIGTLARSRRALPCSSFDPNRERAMILTAMRSTH